MLQLIFIWVISVLSFSMKNKPCIWVLLGRSFTNAELQLLQKAFCLVQLQVLSGDLITSVSSCF